MSDETKFRELQRRLAKELMFVHNTTKGIIDGSKNIAKDSLGLLSEETLEIIRKREEICLSCEKRDGETCLKCGCYLPIKQKSLISGCPESKWGKIN